MEPLADHLLSLYAVSLHGGEQGPYPFAAADLLIPEHLDGILGLQAEQLGFPIQDVVGTLFAKRFSVFCMAAVEAWTLYDYLLPFSPEEIRFAVTHEAEMIYQSEFVPERHMDLHISMVKTEQRNQLLADYIANDFVPHLDRIFCAVSVATGANLRVMWSLVAHNIHNLFLRMAGRVSCRPRLEQLELDRAIWANIAISANIPQLKVRLVMFRDPLDAGQAFYVRPHCCQAYRLVHEGHAHGYCTTCPKPTAQERRTLLEQESRH